MNIAVCDESPSDVESIADLLTKYFSETELPVTICRFCSEETLLYDIEDGVSFDIVFLGVEKNSAVKICSAYRLRQLNFRGKLIIVSSSTDFAVYGYEVGAVGYLPKSCKFFTFRKLMDRIAASFKIDTFLIKHRSSIIKVPFSDISYVESNNSKCTVHTSSGDNYTLYKHLNDIEHELSDNRFLRCHRSFIVNMNCIASADKDFVLKNGERVLIRQKSRKEIKNAYWKFVSQNVEIYR